jgi:hypothetical protein
MPGMAAIRMAENLVRGGPLPTTPAFSNHCPKDRPLRPGIELTQF